MMGVLPTALLLPLALVPVIADYLLNCQLLLIWQCSDCKAEFHPPTWNLWEGRNGESHEKILLNQPGKSWFHFTPTHTGPQYCGTCKELQSLLLSGSITGRKDHLLCSRSGISSLLHSSLESEKGIVLVFMPGFGLSDSPTPAYEHTYTKDSKSKQFIAELPEIIPLWTLLSSPLLLLLP